MGYNKEPPADTGPTHPTPDPAGPLKELCGGRSLWSSFQAPPGKPQLQTVMDDLGIASRIGTRPHLLPNSHYFITTETSELLERGQGCQKHWTCTNLRISHPDPTHSFLRNLICGGFNLPYQSQWNPIRTECWVCSRTIHPALCTRGSSKCRKLGIYRSTNGVRRGASNMRAALFLCFCTMCCFLSS